jgi:hypothetical protein
VLASSSLPNDVLMATFIAQAIPFIGGARYKCVMLYYKNFLLPDAAWKQIRFWV